MAIARKVIILDLKETPPEYLWGIASVVFSVSIGYWLVLKMLRFDLEIGKKNKRKPDINHLDKSD